MSVKDLDLENHCSWQGTLEMLLALCGEAADLSFDCRNFGGWKIPSVEIRLDRPVELSEPTVISCEDAVEERWTYGTVVLAKSRPVKMPKGPVWLLRPDGAAAVTYRAFKEMVRVLQEVCLPVEFAWSSLPLAPLCDDEAVTGRKEKACWELGAVHTLWVRCPQDETLQAAMRNVHRCGQLRVQNMATANTWVTGGLEETKLLQELQ